MRNYPVYDPGVLASATPMERRETIQRISLERAEQRQRELDSQRSPDRLPEERVRTWERLHGLSLPQLATHPLVAVIAKQTQLSLEDIRAEQHRRASPEPALEHEDMRHLSAT